MTRPIRHADLVARALGALPANERERVDRALASDPALRRTFEQVSGHLLLYDQLPAAPPPPPFERLAAALDRPGAPALEVLGLQGRAAPVRRRPAWVPALAAALLLVGFLWARGRGEEPGDAGVGFRPGVGLEVLRGGERLPAAALGRVLPGDLLRCREAAEAQLGERVRLVLDGGARLRVQGGAAVTLEEGRAWFEVAPGPFRVDTAYGPVRVLGTAFEVDLRSEALEVGVGRGRVAAGGQEVSAGERLSAGRVGTPAQPPGEWFRTPRLELQRASTARLAVGEPVELLLLFENPGQVALHLPAPGAARVPVWIGFETPDGRVLGELPVRPENVVSGSGLLEPGGGLDLPAGGRRSVTLRILPPVTSAGAYRCRALYRPEGRPGVLSTPLEIEVR